MKELISKLEEMKAMINDCLDAAKGGEKPKKPVTAPGEGEGEPDGDEGGDDYGSADDVASKLGIMSLKDKLK